MSEIKTNINWFPGHMAKARREMQEKIKLVDLVIEVRDARIPASSVNPLLDEVIGSKPRLIVLAKKDRAVQAITDNWIRVLTSQGNQAVALDLLHDNVASVISGKCEEIMADKISRLKAKGLKHVEIKAMVVGIPNVGKSTMINSVSRKKAAKTADHPGVTKSLSWIKVSPDVALLDTPGVLWPKFEDMEVGYRLAVCGSIPDTVIPLHEVVMYAVSFMCSHYPESLIKRYDISVEGDPQSVLDRICESRRFLDSSGQLDRERGMKVFINELRDGLLGPISFEVADEDQ